MGIGATALSDLDTMFTGWETAVIGATTVNGMFDAEYSEITIGDGMPIGTTKPAFLYKTADVTTPAKDAAVVITSEKDALTSVTYYVVSAKANPPDGGAGTTRLILRK